MRLTADQLRGLRTALKRRFGPRARLWLFGSRTDDAARGGDYDVLVQTDDANAARLVDAKLAFLADLHATPAFDGERIDVVLHATGLEPEANGIRLVALTEGVEVTGRRGRAQSSTWPSRNAGCTRRY